MKRLAFLLSCLSLLTGLATLGVVAASPSTTITASPLYELLNAAPASPGSIGPCSRYWGEHIATSLPPVHGQHVPYALCGYTGTDFRHAYGAPAKWTGKGETIGIVDAYSDPLIRSDVNAYFRLHGLPLMGPRQLRVIQPKSYTQADTCNGDQGWSIEQALDIEAAHAMAPAAQIVYEAAASCGMADLAGAVNDLSMRHVNYISCSWGAAIDAEYFPHLMVLQTESVWRHVNRRGVGLLFASGDNGPYAVDDHGQGIVSPTYPSTSPEVTAVGGTALGTDAHGASLWERPWSDNSTMTNAKGTRWDPAPPGYWVFGGGGGQSQYFPQPAYQRPVVPTSLATFTYDFGLTVRVRTTPDIAMDADPATGMRVGLTMSFPDGKERYGELIVGGTSLAAPLSAGALALIDQKCGCHHGSHLNRWLYSRPQRNFNAVKRSTAYAAGTDNASLYEVGAPTVLPFTAPYGFGVGRGSLNLAALLK